MPRIPQFKASRDPHIPASRLALPSPADISVPKATPTRIVGGGEDILARSLDDVSKSLKDVADVFALKKETARVSESQRIQMGMNDTFRNMLKEISTKTGGQAAGLVDHLRDSEPDLRESFIPEGLDAKTTKELTQHFNSQYNSFAMSTVQHEIRQADIADKVARNLTIQDAHKNISSIPIGDITSIESEIQTVVDLELQRHPNLTENQQETNRRALREDFLTYAITQWSVTNPSAMVTFWDNKKNQAYLKSALSKRYPVVLQKVDSVREDAHLDIATTVVLRLTNNDYTDAANLILEQGENNQFNLTPKQRLGLYKSLSAVADQQYTNEEKVKIKKTENFLHNSHEKFYNKKTQTLDVQGALVNLEQGLREAQIDMGEYDTQKAKILTGGKFSAESAHKLLEDINKREVTTRDQILARTANTNANISLFNSVLDKLNKDIEKGFTTNYFKEAYTLFTNYAKIKKVKDLPAGIKEKGLLVDIKDLPRFKEMIEARARQNGYTANDPRIIDIAEELLKPRWHGGWSLQNPAQEFPEGVSHEIPEEKTGAPWHIFGEEYTRGFQAPDTSQLELSSQIGKYLQTATGGNTEMQKLMGTPEGQTATQSLLNDGITPTLEYLKMEIETLKKTGEKE